MTETSDFPPLPEPSFLVGHVSSGYDADVMRAYVLADRAARAVARTHITWNADGVRCVNGVPDAPAKPPPETAEAVHRLDPNKVRLCRMGSHSAEEMSLGQPCGCDAGSCDLQCGGPRPSGHQQATSATKQQAEAEQPTKCPHKTRSGCGKDGPCLYPHCTTAEQPQSEAAHTLQPWRFGPILSQTSEAAEALFSEALTCGKVWGETIPRHKWDSLRDAQAKLFATRLAAIPATPAPMAVQPYTSAIGVAGHRYMAQFKYAYPLPATFRWQELWDAMCDAARAQEGPKP